jgi:uncharacterized coiled-coil protein SlyX
MKTRTKHPNYIYRSLGLSALLFVSLLMVFFGPLPTTNAVNPPPDGGYPGFNTAEGQNALFSLTTGVANTGIGWYSLWSNTEGSYNTGLGTGTLLFNTANYNTATGAGALLSNTTGLQNTANGAFALFSNTAGFNNVAVGVNALWHNTDGASNIALGPLAGYNLTNGSNNIDIGNEGVAGESQTIRLGQGGIQQRIFIAAIRGVTTGNADAINVVIDSNGQLGTMSSSRRFKKEIKSMGSSSEVIHRLKPVTFHYKSDNTDTPQFGLIAEEVAEVDPDLVVRENNGEIYTVRYEAVNAMLLNEFLKEHRKVEEQQATIGRLETAAAKQEATIAELNSTVAKQEKGLQTVTARLEQQAAQIQKVSAQLEPNKPAPRIVNNNR